MTDYADTTLRISEKTCRAELEGEMFIDDKTIGWFTIMPSKKNEGFLEELEKRWNSYPVEVKPKELKTEIAAKAINTHKK